MESAVKINPMKVHIPQEVLDDPTERNHFPHFGADVDDIEIDMPASSESFSVHSAHGKLSIENRNTG